MSANVIYPRFVDTQDLPADAVLERAKGELATAIVVGFDHAGKPWLYSSLASGPEAVWLLQTGIHRLMQAQESA